MKAKLREVAVLDNRPTIIITDTQEHTFEFEIDDFQEMCAILDTFRDRTWVNPRLRAIQG